MIIHVTKDTFEAEINKAEKVVVDFWATWCGPCRMIGGELEKLSAEGVTVLKVNVDEEEELAVKFGVSSIPTLLYYTNGKLTDKTIGFIPASKIKEHLK